MFLLQRFLKVNLDKDLYHELRSLEIAFTMIRYHYICRQSFPYYQGSILQLDMIMILEFSAIPET